jgi:hypothetical protein
MFPVGERKPGRTPAAAEAEMPSASAVQMERELHRDALLV